MADPVRDSTVNDLHGRLVKLEAEQATLSGQVRMLNKTAYELSVLVSQIVGGMKLLKWLTPFAIVLGPALGVGLHELLSK